MTLDGDVDVARRTTRMLDPHRASRKAREQEFIVRIPAESQDFLVDPPDPFPGFEPRRDRRYVIPGGRGVPFGGYRSEERRVGKEWVSTCSSRGRPDQ